MSPAGIGPGEAVSPPGQSFAQTVVEYGDTRWNPGDLVPDALPGIDELRASGAVASQPPTAALRDGSGALIDTKHIKRFDGDFSPEDIADPDTDTPLLGVHVTAAELDAQTDSGSASA